MLTVVLVAAIVGPAWCFWLDWSERVSEVKVKPESTPTPVIVEWDDNTDSIEDNRAMLDQIFDKYSKNDDDIDPPTVVIARR